MATTSAVRMTTLRTVVTKMTVLMYSAVESDSPSWSL